MGRNVTKHMISHVHFMVLNVLFVIVKPMSMAEGFLHAFIVRLRLSARMISFHMKWNAGQKSVPMAPVYCQKSVISSAGNAKQIAVKTGQRDNNMEGLQWILVLCASDRNSKYFQSSSVNFSNWIKISTVFLCHKQSSLFSFIVLIFKMFIFLLQTFGTHNNLINPFSLWSKYRASRLFYAHFHHMEQKWNESFISLSLSVRFISRLPVNICAPLLLSHHIRCAH